MIKSEFGALRIAVGAMLAFFAGEAQATETITYQYDAKGRLIEVKRTGTVNNNVQTNYTHDKANNRKTVVVTGSGGNPPPPPPPPSGCTFAANNNEGNEEFSVFVPLQKTSPCSGPVTVAFQVEWISGGGGAYFVYPPTSGIDFATNENYEYARVAAYNGTVEPNDPLILKITWSITSGSGTITQPVSYATFYDEYCYC